MGGYMMFRGLCLVILLATPCDLLTMIMLLCGRYAILWLDCGKDKTLLGLVFVDTCDRSIMPMLTLDYL